MGTLFINFTPNGDAYPDSQLLEIILANYKWTHIGRDVTMSVSNKLVEYAIRYLFVNKLIGNNFVVSYDGKPVNLDYIEGVPSWTSPWDNLAYEWSKTFLL